MKLGFNLKQHLKIEKIATYTLVCIFSLLYLHTHMVQQVLGAQSQDDPHISLKVKNQPLGDVLKKITSDTGYKFKLNRQWSIYRVNASIENMPLDRGLKIILQGLNHAIIYESDKTIKLMVYGKVDSRKTDSYPIRPLSSQIQESQQEPPPSPESSSDEADELNRADDSPKETDSLETPEDKSPEKEDSSDSEKQKSSEETDTAAGQELDQGSSDQGEKTNEENEQGNAAEETPPKSPQ